MTNGKHTILVVDDSLTQLAVLQDTLEKEGFAVETAQNGVEAITKAYHTLPSLILSDVLMPELNGYHLCRLLKNDPRTADIPIILLTNLRERHDRFWGENAGADRYLEKGSDLSPIVAAVRELLPPSPPPQAEPAAPPTRIGDEEIRSRVTDILDRLLYESTISNEILKLTGQAHDIDLLAREFLDFLNVISRHSAAGLLLRDGRDKYVLCLQAAASVSDDFIEAAKREALTRAGLDPQDQARTRFVLLHAREGSDDLEAGELHHLHTLPIVEGEEMLASLSLFDTRPRGLTEGMRHALATAADRFLIVARYLRKFKEIEEVKADFVSMLVHDMRSPLTSIRGFTDVLVEGILGQVNDEQRGALKNIQSGCDRLLLLIEDILDLSKLEAGKMQISPIPLQILPLAERAVTDLSATFREKGLTVRIEIPQELPYAMADGKQLARVLTNLLSNAAKFTSAGGKIVLTATQPAICPTAELKACLQVSVIDNGPGIPSEQQQKLFSRYQQLHPASMFRKGTGLGLAICKEITTLHGGTIWVESPVDQNGGSRFTFTLPLCD